jgi:MFS family permease
MSSSALEQQPASDRHWLVLGIVASERQWVVTAYALAFGSLLLLGGRLGDMFSRKRVFITA